MTLKQRAVVEKIANGYEARAAECENTRWSPVSHHKALRACLEAADRATLSVLEIAMLDHATDRLRMAAQRNIDAGQETSAGYDTRQADKIQDFIKSRIGGA
jgi:hypothetical protein